MIALAIYHVGYLVLTRRGRTLVAGFRPRLADASAALNTFLFNAGFKPRKPEEQFPGYVEKAEYWALIWGTIIMAVTGVLLWYENLTLRFLPLWALNLFTAVHFYEAILATLAIVVWHLYFVVFDPTVYPLKSSKRKGVRKA